MASDFSSTGFIVFAHGSSIESANEAVRDAARKLHGAMRSGDGPQPFVEAAFLEGGRPDLNAAVGLLLGRGADRIVIVPYFLTLGLHLQRDLPTLADAARAAHPGVNIEITAPLDGHPALIGALLGRAREAASVFTASKEDK